MNSSTPENGCSADSNEMKQNSLGALGVFLTRVRQMDAKKLQEMVVSQNINSGTMEDVAARERAFDVVYGSNRENSKSSKEKASMCFVVDAHDRRICIVSREEQKKQEHLIHLEEISNEQFARFGQVVKESNAEISDKSVHCDKCSLYYEFCCLEHPLYLCNDRSPSSNASNSPLADGEERAASTLPAFLYIQNSQITTAGKGVFTKVDIPAGIVFGPYEGILTQNQKEAESSGYAWELRTPNNKAPYYLDAKDSRYSNWMRYINSPRNESEQNLIAFQYCGSVYYRVFKPIDRSAELLVWYGKGYGKELGIVELIKQVPRAFVYYAGKSPFVL